MVGTKTEPAKEAEGFKAWLGEPTSPKECGDGRAALTSREEGTCPTSVSVTSVTVTASPLTLTPARNRGVGSAISRSQGELTPKEQTNLQKKKEKRD